MQLTTSQMTNYSLLPQHFGEYYDLQSELVDHLANSIDAMGTISKRTFEEALNIEFKKFGIYGFMDVVYKDSGPKQKYYKIVWNYFKDFLVSQNYIVGLSFIYCFKIECLQREYIFFFYTFIIYRYVL
jgi:hypothetical protein